MAWVLYIPTRWNLIYLMLDTVLKYQKAFENNKLHVNLL